MQWLLAAFAYKKEESLIALEEFYIRQIVERCDALTVDTKVNSVILTFC